VISSSFGVPRRPGNGHCGGGLGGKHVQSGKQAARVQVLSRYRHGATLKDKEKLLANGDKWEERQVAKNLMQEHLYS
jgi:hypothetical protein